MRRECVSKLKMKRGTGREWRDLSAQAQIPSELKGDLVNWWPWGLCAWKEAKRSFGYLFSFLLLAHQGRACHSSLPQHFIKDVGLVHFHLVGLALSGYKGVWGRCLLESAIVGESPLSLAEHCWQLLAFYISFRQPIIFKTDEKGKKKTLRSP